MSLLLKNGYVVDSKNSREGVFDVLVENGRISAVSANIAAEPSEIIDCTGLTVIPGVCDMHVHMRDPGQTHKEDFITAGEAGAAGGVTAAVCMPNTSPVIDTPERVRDVIARSKASKIKVYPCACITKGQEGKELCDFAELRKAGAVAVSDDGKPVSNARVMLEAMRLAHKVGIRIISHCEDLDIAGGGIINEGEVSRELGIGGISRSSESVMVAREICLADVTKTHIHIAHVSTKEAAAHIKSAAQRGIMITCETAPHYFTLTDSELLKEDADYRMNPPLREFEDVLEITKALCNDVFDCIASDHAPHSPAEKADFLTAPNGVIGLETLLPVTLTRLYHTGRLSLAKIVKMMCVNPRWIVGIGGGGLESGAAADIAVLDLNENWTVDPDKLRSKSKNTCFKGMRLKGRVKYTIVDGNIVYRE